MTTANGMTPSAAGGQGGSSTPPGRFPGPIWRGFSRTIKTINSGVGFLAGFMVVASCVIITNEVFFRYYLHRPHTWNLEVNIFLLIGATFLAAGFTQMRRAHVGTEVLQTIMSARWNRWRILAGDILSALLCGFTGVMVLQYDWQAWAKGWTTDSTWAPPLWIPYTLIGVGLVLITLEYIVQIVEEIRLGGER